MPVGDRNDGWRTKCPVTRRSGDKTPGFRVTGFLLWNGRFGLARDGRFGQRSLLFAFLFKTKGVLTWELYKCSVHLFMVSICLSYAEFYSRQFSDDPFNLSSSTKQKIR